jgi:phosphoserine phosphatase
LTLLGIDQPGILANISEILTRHGVNIETIKTQVRNGYIFNQLIIDCTNTGDTNVLRNELRKTCEKFNLSLVLEKEKVYRKNKKLIAFDMDSTLIVGETIVEIAKRVNKEDEMNQATEYAMNSDIDFESSLRERAKMLEGISEGTLREIAKNLKISQGIEELIHHLKGMGYRIALISSGFSLFTDQMKNKLDLDYSFGNTLEVVDGYATGKIIGDIIDGKGKWDIVKDIAHDLNISMDEVVTVGDGSNDREMLQNSGLGIGFNSKEIASEVADGRIADQDAYLIMLMLGLSDTEIEEIINQRL